MKKLVFLRRFSQVFFAAVFVYILWFTSYPLAGVLAPDTFFKINPLVMIFTSISERVLLPGMVFVILILVLTLILGRFFCGWICPLGAVIDLCGNTKKKKVEFKDLQSKILRSIKFYILGVIALASFLGIQIAWIFDPMGITARFVSLNLIPTLTLGLERIFIFLITRLDFYVPLYDFYRSLKSSLLEGHIYYFSHSAIILIFFVLICASTFITRRFWCRTICPLGAIYAIMARFSLLRRTVEECTECLRCKEDCRMSAIKDDLDYIKGECILCMDCIYDCPTNKTRFSWKMLKVKEDTGDMSRREFILLMLCSFLSLGFRGRRQLIGEGGAGVIRPPAALKENEFLNRCIRCGNCMKVCITNGLQPAIFESGLQGIWTPHLVPEMGYCEYNCTLCGNVCPTGAIPRLTLEEKKKVKLGVAEVDRSICIAWSKDMDCIVCEEHCPVSNKAIKVIEDRVGSRIVLRPYVDPVLCVGCGICQNKCPARPIRAIKVSPQGSYRTQG